MVWRTNSSRASPATPPPTSSPRPAAIVTSPSPGDRSKPSTAGASRPPPRRQQPPTHHGRPSQGARVRGCTQGSRYTAGGMGAVVFHRHVNGSSFGAVIGQTVFIYGTSLAIRSSCVFSCPSDKAGTPTLHYGVVFLLRKWPRMMGLIAGPFGVRRAAVYIPDHRSAECTILAPDGVALRLAPPTPCVRWCPTTFPA